MVKQIHAAAWVRSTVFVAIASLVFLISPAIGGEYPIPHLTGGNQDWNDYLLVDNFDDSAGNFTIRIYDSGGQIYENEFIINGFSSRAIDLKSLADGGDCGLVTTEADDDLQFRLAFENRVGGGVAEFALEDREDDELSFLFSNFSSNIDWKGTALANLNSQTADVKLYVISDGNVLESTTLSIPPFSKVAAFHYEWFPGLSLDQVQVIAAVSNIDLSGIVIYGSLQSEKLLFSKARNQLGISRILANYENSWDYGEDYYGIVRNRPSGVAGDWEIGDRTFVAEFETQLDEDDGQIEIGTCVSVDIEDGRVFEIESEPLADCGISEDTGHDDSGGDADDDSSSDDDSWWDDEDFYGIVEARPTGAAGTWSIGGRTFTTDSGTAIQTDDGPVSVGACVSVDFDDGRVFEIESEPLADCGISGGNGDDSDDMDDDDD
ncbi:MAG: hypothetical protein ACLFPR_03470 [Desulfococcaceae bacterium]